LRKKPLDIVLPVYSNSENAVAVSEFIFSCQGTWSPRSPNARDLGHPGRIGSGIAF